MAWYRAGTVSVTNGSTTVIGSGTAFVANVQVGEEFRLQGGSIGYEIAAVVSNTQLTLAVAYLGSTQSGEDYEIMPVRGFLKEAYDALQSGISTLSSYTTTALAGRFTDGSDAEPGISFVSDGNTGIRRSAADTLALITNGVKRVILGNSAMQVNVPITGSAVQSSAADATAGRLLKVGAAGAALGADVYHRANLLGTVSQSGGTPTGAAMQRGSNANGQFARFADGTQICSARLTLTYVGGFACTLTWTYPAAFVGTAPLEVVLGATIEESAGSYTPSIAEIQPPDINTLGATSGQIRVRRSTGATDFQPGDTVVVRAWMIGRWF